MRCVGWLIVLGAACSGPPATDAEVCRDVIRRLCVSRCPEADSKLGLAPADDCAPLLTARSGCGSDSFMFQNRASFLSCRIPIIRSSDAIDAVPPCEDVDDMFRGCPTMVQFFGGP